MNAALSGCVETVSCLLQLGADPNLLNNRGRPALHHALQSGDVDCVEMLVGDTSKGDHYSMLDFPESTVLFRIELMC